MSDHEKPVGLPKCFMFQGRVRCDCDAGEILTESVILPWDTPREHVHWMVDKMLDSMKAEAQQHLTKQRTKAGS